MSFAAFADTLALRGLLHRRRGWLAYALAWVALALLWSVTAAASSGMSPRVTVRFGLVIMGTAGALGVGVWWLTGRLPWDRRSLGFYAVHACSAVLYAVSYSAATLVLELFEGRFSRGLASAWTSGVLGWNGLHDRSSRRPVHDLHAHVWCGHGARSGGRARGQSVGTGE